jgi:hypothetical protein
MRTQQNGITIHSLLQKEEEQKEAKKIIKNHKPGKLHPYPAGDKKTVFYCSSDDKGLKAVNEFKRRQNKW